MSCASGSDEPAGFDQVHDPLLAGDAAYEAHDRVARIHPPPFEDVGAGVGAVLVRIDPVVDDGHPSRVELRVRGQQVRAHCPADGDHGVGGVDPGPFAELRDLVAAGAELFGLPRAERLQAVAGHDVGNAVQEFGEVPGEVGVPGVAVDEVDALQGRGHGQVDGEDPQGRLRLPGRVRGRDRDGPDPQPGAGWGGRARGAEAPHLHLDLPGQLAREVFDVDAGTAVDLGRVLAGQQADPHHRGADTFALIDGERAVACVVPGHALSLDQGLQLAVQDADSTRVP